MLKIIKLLNEMKEKKIIQEYGIGGATALIYYFEPIQTQDIDVFVVIDSSSLLVSLRPIYEFLEQNGGEVKDEYIIIHNTPVQFLVPYNPLIDAALNDCIEASYADTWVRIFSFEYLMAIMIQTGRGKDKARLEEILKVKLAFNQDKLQSILTEFELSYKWEKIQSGFDL